jgi:endothelin-converting enzyme/putative endopeptidase
MKLVPTCGVAASIESPSPKSLVRLGGKATLLLTVLMTLSACHSTNNLPDPAIKAASPQANWGVDTANIVNSIQPGDDFYRYVNKGWLDKAKIPAGLPAIDSFTEVRLRTEQQLETLIQALLGKPLTPGTPEQHVIDLYRSYLDTQGRNQRGIEMLKDELDGILKAKDRRELAGRMGRMGYDPLVGTGVIVDWHKPTQYILALEQEGLGLPGRDYYLKDGEPFVGHRAAYLAYIEGALQRAGIANAKPRAQAILAFEIELAKRQWSSEQMRDSSKLYHVMSKQQLQAYAPGFDWEAFLKASGYADVDRLQVATDIPIKDMAAVYAKTPMDTLRSYVAFHYLNHHAPLLADDWSDAYFDLFSRRLMGIAEQRPLEKRALKIVNDKFGEELGKLYVARYFPPESMTKTQEMVGYIMQSMKERLEKLDWMDEPTRQEALAKLASFRVLVGYPTQWHDHSSVNIRQDDLVGNMGRLAQWQRTDDRAKLAEPVRTWELGSHPQNVDAYYSKDTNQIAFFAAILQPPFFNPDADPAVNFGSIGAVVGHEIGHGFDDQGSQYDGSGKMRNWWTDASRTQFELRAQRLVNQYNAYSPLQGVQVNGQLTLGENIGDLGGISMAYSAYQKYVAAKYPNAASPVLDGFTGNQRFFLGFAQLWRQIKTDDTMRNQILTDPHSPGEFRCNGVVRNFDPWYEAFDVKESNALFLLKADRVSIW